MIPFNLAMLGLSRLAWLGAYLLSHLLWRDSQRAEYLADYLAATVSGTNAVLSLLEKLHYGTAFALTVQHAALNQDASEGLLERLRQRVAEVPERELVGFVNIVRRRAVALGGKCSFLRLEQTIFPCAMCHSAEFRRHKCN